MNSATLAAILLICAGVIHNYSFMCRKLRPEERKVNYPATPSGQLLFDLSWILLAAAGLYLSFTLSPLLSLIAAAIYFLFLPFVLQPPLARLLGFRNLTDYVNRIDRRQGNKNGD